MDLYRNTATGWQNQIGYIRTKMVIFRTQDPSGNQTLLDPEISGVTTKVRFFDNI